MPVCRDFQEHRHRGPSLVWPRSLKRSSGWRRAGCCRFRSSSLIASPNRVPFTFVAFFLPSTSFVGSDGPVFLLFFLFWFSPSSDSDVDEISPSLLLLALSLELFPLPVFVFETFFLSSLSDSSELLTCRLPKNAYGTGVTWNIQTKLLNKLWRKPQK